MSTKELELVRELFLNSLAFDVLCADVHFRKSTS